MPATRAVSVSRYALVGALCIQTFASSGCSGDPEPSTTSGTTGAPTQPTTQDMTQTSAAGAGVDMQTQAGTGGGTAVTTGAAGTAGDDAERAAGQQPASAGMTATNPVAGAGGSATQNTAGAAATGDGVAGMAGGQAGMPAAGAEADTTAPTNELWIATTGADSNPGTEDMPLASLGAAVERATAGMTIWVNAGTYKPTNTITLSTVGTEGQPVKIFAIPGQARPIIDFAAQPRGDSKSRGLEISGDHWHLRGLDVINAGDNCIHIAGAHNTIEWVVTHDCSDTGIQISANSADADDATRAAHNLVLNCDSYSNYDAQNQGENADGFAAKLYIGPGNVFRGCRAWNNADDGWDLFASDDVVVIEDCWAIANGKIGPNQNNTNGDGNGFKLGGAAKSGDPNMGGAPHEVNNCYSVENAACGFVRNNNTQTPRLSMCGGRGDGKGTFCSVSSAGNAVVTTRAAQAIAAERDRDGNLPAMP